LPFAEAAVAASSLEVVDAALCAVETLATSWASEVHEAVIEDAQCEKVWQDREPGPVRIEPVT
jgi:hypothetical protein